jgi:hypothetical protein
MTQLSPGSVDEPGDRQIGGGLTADQSLRLVLKPWWCSPDARVPAYQRPMPSQWVAPSGLSLADFTRRFGGAQQQRQTSPYRRLPGSYRRGDRVLP